MNNLRARADESLETRSSSAYRHVGARAAIRVHAARHGSVRIRAAYGLQAARWTDAPARTRPGCPIGDSGPAGQNLNFKSGTYGSTTNTVRVESSSRVALVGAS